MKNFIYTIETIMIIVVVLSMFFAFGVIIYYTTDWGAVFQTLKEIGIIALSLGIALIVCAYLKSLDEKSE